MVRDNWETRCEKAEARRLAAKQRKQRRDSRGTFKAMVLDFFAMLDRHGEGGARPRIIHVWTDSIPSDSPPLLDMVVADGKSGKGRLRSGSLGSEKQQTNRKGRGRSGSMNEDHSKKKAHPRSKDVVPEVAVEESSEVPRLCGKSFFGKCDDISKKGGCRFIHMPVRYKALGQVVNDKDKKNVQEALSLSQEAAANQGGGDDAGSIDMVYYLSIDTKQAVSVPNEEEGSSTLSDLVSRALADKSCAIASVVYVAVNNVLVFDRYREGVVVSDSELQTVVQSDLRRLRSTSVVSDDSDDVDDGKGDNVVLPGPVLEYILMFLPDSAVASMSSVCRAWHHEIGQDSPELWRHMMERHHWPMPESSETETSESPRDAIRKCFLDHFSVYRDIEAVRLAMGALMNPSRKSVEEKEMVYQLFSARRLAPQNPNSCVAVHSWSESQVLMAYSHDCTLRLFKAVDKSADGGNPRSCRELVCVSVDPYRNTKKRHCILVAMDLDEDVIGCLCHVMGDRHEKETYILTVISRDDFLCSDGSGTNALHVIDVGEAVLNYLLSCEEVDHRLLRLYDFLTDGGDPSDIEILVSQSIQASGYGRFLVEVAISIPSVELEEEEGEEVMILLDRKVILFSAAAGAILWMGDSSPADEMLPRHEDVTTASFKQCLPGDRRYSCSLAFVSSASPMIALAEVDPAGQMQCPQFLEASAIVRSDLLENDWQMQRVRHRPVIVTSTDIVVVDALFREIEGEEKARKSVVSFYPRFVDGISYATITLEGKCEAMRIENMHDDYAVILCRMHGSPTSAEFDDIDGQWFEGANSSTTTICAIVIHVPSRREIHRACLLEEASAFRTAENSDIPIFFASDGNTVGVGVWWKGVILTGADVRDVGSNVLSSVEEEQSRSARKKKKKLQPAKSGKKDGMARKYCARMR